MNAPAPTLASVGRLADMKAALAEYEQALNEGNFSEARRVLACIEGMANGAWYGLIGLENAE